ncbi:hypothetical protein Tco_0861689 [Tanacetum coccineum]|uniref:Uncharacterized protein n=1 Tax=Tanacetum coccineum TaxID=301880 RepID=A0ABQ5BLE9_9ASTR
MRSFLAHLQNIHQGRQEWFRMPIDDLRRARIRYSGANLSLLLLYILKELAHAKSDALSRYNPEQARITETCFEVIAKKEKEQIVEKKIDVILPLQSEFASPKIKGSLNADEYIGVEEVVGGGEWLRIDEDYDLCNAATEGGDDAVESRDISILNSLIGHGSPRSLQLCGTIGTTDVQVLIDKEFDKEV